MERSINSKIDEFKNAIILVLATSLIAGAGTWVWTLNSMVSRNELQEVKASLEKESEKDISHFREVSEAKLDTIINKLDVIDKQIQKLENRR